MGPYAASGSESSTAFMPHCMNRGLSCHCEVLAVSVGEYVGSGLYPAVEPADRAAVRSCSGELGQGPNAAAAGFELRAANAVGRAVDEV